MKHFSAYDQDELRELMMRSTAYRAPDDAPDLPPMRSDGQPLVKLADDFTRARPRTKTSEFAAFAGVSHKTAHTALCRLHRAGFVSRVLVRDTFFYMPVTQAARSALPKMPWEDLV